MIDFACKEFRIEEIVKCSLGLSKADHRMFTWLREHPGEHDTQELAKALKLDLSTVQRGMKRLVDADVIDRRQKNLHGGGYVYVYAARPKEACRKRIKTIVKEWTGRVEREIEKW